MRPRLAAVAALVLAALLAAGCGGPRIERAVAVADSGRAFV